MKIFVSNEQPEKAFLPILVTLFGIVIFASKENPLKLSALISVTPYGIETDVILLIKLILPGKKLPKSFPGRQKVILKKFASEDSSGHS